MATVAYYYCSRMLLGNLRWLATIIIVHKTVFSAFTVLKIILDEKNIA